MSIKLNLKHIATIIFIIVAGGLVAQKGILSGKVYDKSSGETIIGAIIEVKKEGSLVAGDATDFDGNYLIELEEGNYEVSIGYLSYARHTVADVTISPKQVNTVDVSLESETVSLVEIVVKADALRSTEVSVIALQRNAAGIQDGVSSQQISRTGSSHAADAIRQLPAATIQDGRYIVM